MRDLLPILLVLSNLNRRMSQLPSPNISQENGLEQNQSSTLWMWNEPLACCLYFSRETFMKPGRRSNQARFSICKKRIGVTQQLKGSIPQTGAITGKPNGYYFPSSTRLDVHWLENNLVTSKTAKFSSVVLEMFFVDQTYSNIALNRKHLKGSQLCSRQRNDRASLWNGSP